MSRRGHRNIKVPPEKGSFPLDHFNECAQSKELFMKCVRAKNTMNDCRVYAREYLQCRMDRGLMNVEDLHTLGFAENNTEEHSQQLSKQQQHE